MIDATKPAPASASVDRPRQPQEQHLQRPGPQPPLPAARPRGDARTASACSSRASSRSRSRAGSRATTRAGRASSAGSTSSTKSKRIRSYRPAAQIAIAPAGDRLHGRRDRRRRARPDLGVPEPDAEHRDPRQPGLPAEHRRLARRAAALQRRHAGVRERDRRRAQRQPRATRARRSSSTCTSARAQPEAGKKKLFFANVWAIAFTKQSGSGAGVRRLVGQRPAGEGQRRRRTASSRNTVDADTTRYIDLNDPANPATSGDNAGKNPQGIVINRRGHARLRRELRLAQRLGRRPHHTTRVLATIRTAPLPAPGSPEEVVAVGAEMFFSSRGNFNRPAGATVSTDERLSSEGWQSCASCHFKGLTDGVVWQFGVGPRKSVPLNATLQPQQPDRAARPQLLGDLRRGRGLRGQHPQRLRARARSRPPLPCSARRRRRRARSIRTTAC